MTQWCSFWGSFTFFFINAPPLISCKYSATALRADALRFLAFLSQTQQWIPLRPEKTQRIWRNPKSSVKSQVKGKVSTFIYFDRIISYCLFFKVLYLSMTRQLLCKLSPYISNICCKYQFPNNKSLPRRNQSYQYQIRLLFRRDRISFRTCVLLV